MHRTTTLVAAAVALTALASAVVSGQDANSYTIHKTPQGIKVDSGLWAALQTQYKRLYKENSRIMHGWEAANHTFPEVTLDTTHGTLATQLAAEVKKARQQNRTPVVDVGSVTCGPCYLVDSIIHLPTMRPVMKKLYVIHVDASTWEAPLTAMAAAIGSDINGIPRMFMLNYDGQLAGEAWRPSDTSILRNVPDSLWKGKGDEAQFRQALIVYFSRAEDSFAKGQWAKPSKPPRQAK